jgi:recombination associated protein RdgC
MWFKNLRIYKLTEALSDDQFFSLTSLLQAQEFKPCGSLDLMRYGFVQPVGEGFEHTLMGFTMICAKREEKVLPSGAINDAVAAKVKAIEEGENRNVGRKERQTIKDEVIFSMLPKAFTKSSLDYAYIDHQEQLIIVNASSASRAEDLCSKLREALGSLKCIPLTPKCDPSQIMTMMASAGAQAPFELGEYIELKAGKDERVVSCRKQDLSASTVLSHIQSGMYVSKLQLNWREGVTFVIEDDFAIKRLTFDSSIADKANDGNPESKAEQFDADFAVMTVELRALITDLVAEFGGISNPE